MRRRWAGIASAVSLGAAFVLAGVAIALAVLVLNGFPPWGHVLGTVLLGSVVVNELVGPVLFRLALARAGEIPESDPATDAMPAGRRDPQMLP
ncbi:MAG: hypothetical protein ABI779_22410 [Acidobacteriota bacterium]